MSRKAWNVFIVLGVCGAVCAAGFDFESGDLQGWKVVSGAFERPVTDLAKEHNTGKPYTKGGRCFLSTLESKTNTPRDGQTGVIESPLVRLASPAVTFKIGGGRSASMTLVDRKTGAVYASASGVNGEEMRTVTWRIPQAVGRDVFFRVTDVATGGWGHLTVDDIVFDGTIGAGDFDARCAEAEAREPSEWPVDSPVRLLIVKTPGVPSIGNALFDALGRRVAVSQATPDKADARLAKDAFDLVVLHGGAELRDALHKVLTRRPKAKILWLVTQGAGIWGLRGTGVPLVELYGASPAVCGKRMGEEVSRALGLGPIASAAFASAEAAIRELATRFPAYPADRFLNGLKALELSKGLQEPRGSEDSSAPGGFTGSGGPGGVRKAFDVLLLEALVRANPLVNAHEIAFTTRAQYAQDHHNTATIFQHGEINQNSYRTQGALKALDPKTGATRVIVPEEKGRTVRDPEVDYDGARIVFSLRRGREDDYHVHTVNADGTGLKQITFAKGVSDIDPVWLPDGDILFSSTRNPKYCMCNRHIMANLYRMKPDGANIHQLGVSTLFEGHSSVLPDGRILYDRWEYVDRNFGDAQGLWVCNPDGTRHAIYWGNNTTSPGGVVNARAIDDTDASKVIAVLGSCHDMPWGALGIIDRAKGVDGRDPVIRTWPASYRERIHAGGREDFDSTRALPVKYADPYPVDATHFLATRMTGRAGEMGIVYLDLHGNEVLVHEETPGCHTPVILRPSKRPVVQYEKRNFDAPTAPGLFYVQNVYIGTHMQGVKPGAVKALRVVESPEKRSWTGPRGWQGHGEEAPAMNWHSFENKRILGTVPVEEDGSAYFELPANTFVYFQALDEEGKLVQSMRSGAYVQPGETYGCVGCHENRVGEAAPVTKKPRAMCRAPSKLDGAYNLAGLEKGTPPHFYSFQKEVQPVFTKNCVSCHDYGGKAGGKLNLSGDRGAYFCTSYVDLWALGAISCVGGGPASIQAAYGWGSHASRLTRKLYGHGNVRLSAEDRDRVITWMDINAPYYPRYECAYPDNPGGRMPLTFAEMGELERLCGTRISNSNGARQREQLDFDRPECSRILAGAKGGPEREKALALIRAGQARLAKTPRCDMEGFVPCVQDREREIRYQKRLAEERRVYEAIRQGVKVYDPR